MIKSRSERTANTRVVLLGGREVIAEGVRLNFWADISHRCMTASWPAFIAGAALVFVVFNAVKAGHEAVMQRWLISAQKLRRTPSAMTSRPPSSTTRVFAVRSLRLLIIFQNLLRAHRHLIGCAIMA